MMKYKIIPLFLIALLFFSSSVSAQVVTSISKVEFISDDTTIQGDAFLVNVILEGSSQKLTGDLRKSEIDRVTTTPEEIKQGFTLDFDLTEQTCRYPISRTRDMVYRLLYERETHWVGLNAGKFKNDCFAKPYTWVWFGKKPYTWDYYCVWLSPEAEIAEIPEHMLSFESDVSIRTDDGKIATGTISNLEDKSTWLESYGQNVAHVRWTGLLWSGLSCPAYEATYGAIWYNDRWMTVRDKDISSYVANNRPGVLGAILTTDASQVEVEISKWNIWTDAVETPLMPPNSKVEGEREIERGQVVYTPTGLLYYPQLTLRLKADWIGVVVPVGEPEIISLNIPEFITGETGYLEANIKNIGDGEGSFVIKTVCDPPVTVEEPSKTEHFDAGEEKSVTIRLSGETAKESETTSCEVTAYDIENPDKMDSKIAQVTIKKIIICETGSRECYSKRVLRVCEIGSWKYYECPEGKVCDYVDGVAKCVKEEVEEGPPPPVCKLWDLDCHLRKVTEAVKTMLIIIGVIVIAGILIYLIYIFKFKRTVPWEKMGIRRF